MCTKTHIFKFCSFPYSFFSFLKILLRGLENFLSAVFHSDSCFGFPHAFSLHIFKCFDQIFSCWGEYVLILHLSGHHSDYLFNLKLFSVSGSECFLFWKPNFNHILVKIYLFLSIVCSYFIDSIELCIIT